MENITAEQAGQMNFTLPHDVVTLPTGGIFYKSKKKSVKVGYLTASDENVLISVIGSNTTTNQIIMNLIRSKVYENDIHPEELLEGVGITQAETVNPVSSGRCVVENNQFEPLRVIPPFAKTTGSVSNSSSEEVIGIAPNELLILAVRGQ
jgi:hypothetical protein